VQTIDSCGEVKKFIVQKRVRYPSSCCRTVFQKFFVITLREEKKRIYKPLRSQAIWKAIIRDLKAPNERNNALLSTNIKITYFLLETKKICSYCFSTISKMSNPTTEWIKMLLSNDMVNTVFDDYHRYQRSLVLLS
jgi:hypothetical protein